jgi:hypothetical protein
VCRQSFFKKRVGANGVIAAGSVAIERKGAHRGVVFAVELLTRVAVPWAVLLDLG